MPLNGYDKKIWAIMEAFFTNYKHTKSINWIVAGGHFAVLAKKYPYSI